MLCASRKCRIRCKQSSSYPLRCSMKNILPRDLQGPSKRQPSLERSSRRRRFLNPVRSKMGETKSTVLVTGISGNLGLRLLPQLAGFNVLGVDLNPPQTDLPLSFERMDLGQEESCRQLYLLMRQISPVAVVHLAFVIDPVRTGVLDVDRMWQINVAGTARVMEAISEANRDVAVVEKFIFPSSVAAYGSDLPRLVTEDSQLAAHTYVYGVHKMEADRVVQQRSPALRGCSVYILRPHIFAGASVGNYFMEAFRGIPGGTSKRAARMREKGTRLPCMLPSGTEYLLNKI